MFVYIDGFNLYNRALIRSPYKWLNLGVLAERVLGTDAEAEVTQIKYFTSWVSGRKDPDQPIRQQAYVRALKTLPNISIFMGRFLSRPIIRPLINNPSWGKCASVEVNDTREKGSDVNLASHLVWDGARGAYDLAVVVSKDTDLVEPIRIVRDEIKKHVRVVSPDGGLSDPLRKVAGSVFHIHAADLKASQFPDVLKARSGKSIRKPAIWG